LFEIAFGARIASAFNFEAEQKNIILVALRDFDFSHRLGPKAEILAASGCFPLLIQ
jgi:hypothetical protein